MKRSLLLLAALAATFSLAAAPLFKGATESKWTATKGGGTVGTVTLLTSPTASRAEWRSGAKSPAVVFIAANQKMWVRQPGGDVELASYSGSPESLIVPVLLESNSSAVYKKDASGPSSIDLTVGGTKYSLARTSFSTSSADASNFVVRPKKAAASRLARLSGGLLGPSQSTVSATAGGRGAGKKGLKLADGGDYAAVEKLEDRDASWNANLEAALAEFQKDGKVGKGRNQ